MFSGFIRFFMLHFNCTTRLYNSIIRLRIEEENPSIQLDHESTNTFIQHSSVIDMNVLSIPVDKSIIKRNWQ